MAMEQRQTKIREGAGLEESRLNTEFIDLMSKWGPHLVTALAILVGCYVGYDWWQKRQAKSNDLAFQDLDAALASGSPANLESVAKDHAGTAVAMDANLKAAELHLAASRTGVPVGARFNEPSPPGQPPKDTNALADDKPFLTDEERTRERADADRLFAAVAEQANSTTGQSLLAIAALNGRASLAEDRAELDKAKSYYQLSLARADALKIDKLSAAIKKRLDSVDTLKDAPKLLAAADVPGFEKPVVSSLGGVTAKSSTGETFTIGPDGKITPVPSPTGATPIKLPNEGSLNLPPTTAPNPPTPLTPPGTAPAPALAPVPAPAAPTTPPETPPAAPPAEPKPATP